MADGYSIKHRDEFETMEGSGDCTWLLARKALGTEAFGYNLVEIGPGGQIPEHDEPAAARSSSTRSSRARRSCASTARTTRRPAGTFASLEPAGNRTILNRSDAPVRPC